MTKVLQNNTTKTASQAVRLFFKYTALASILFPSLYKSYTLTQAVTHVEYNTRKGKYFLLHLSSYADQPLSINNTFSMISNYHTYIVIHSYSSTSNKPNVNYRVISHFCVSLNRQYSKDVVNKYFKRLRELLKDKLLAIKNRTSQTKKIINELKRLSVLARVIT